MKVGDLVSVTMHTGKAILGLIEDNSSTGNGTDPIDAMFPYRVCFSDCMYDDWYEPSSIKVISASQ